ncbi:MAG: hypothetical protein SGPRY_012622, partial [Prymnesium sp.]
MDHSALCERPPLFSNQEPGVMLACESAPSETAASELFRQSSRFHPRIIAVTSSARSGNESATNVRR